MTRTGSAAWEERQLARDFADVESMLRYLRQADETFALLIEDYIDAKRALAHWRRSRRSERAERIAEYDEVVDALTREIRERIEAESKRSHR